MEKLENVFDNTKKACEALGTPRSSLLTKIVDTIQSSGVQLESGFLVSLGDLKDNGVTTDEILNDMPYISQAMGREIYMIATRVGEGFIFKPNREIKGMEPGVYSLFDAQFRHFSKSSDKDPDVASLYA